MTAPLAGPFFRVDVFSDDHGHWMEWATWLDQATAYAERDFARDECGYDRVRVSRMERVS